MKNQNTPWKKISEHELQSIYGGGWFDDFKHGFKEGFDWAKGGLDDLISLFK